MPNQQYGDCCAVKHFIGSWRRRRGAGRMGEGKRRHETDRAQQHVAASSVAMGSKSQPSRSDRAALCDGSLREAMTLSNFRNEATQSHARPPYPAMRPVSVIERDRTLAGCSGHFRNAELMHAALAGGGAVDQCR